MFPEAWYSERISARAESLNPDEYNRSLDVVDAALSKYPDSVLKSDLDAIYILHSLEFFGAAYGGTYTNGVVYLSNKGERFSYSDEYIEKVFHAEFSSVLFNAYQKRFQKDKWAAVNSEDFEYGSGGMQALREGKSSEVFEAELNGQGFLNQYALSSLENDFNSVVKNIFCPGDTFWELTDSQPRLAAKRQLVIDFYHSIHPSFDEAFFRSLQAEEDLEEQE